MVRITPCISVVIQRKAVKNQELLEKWIKEDNPSFTSYDDDLICMTIAMNPYDARSSVENLNKRLGIQIYDESNPYEPVAKDGVVVERMFGFGAPCNWVRREKIDRADYLEYIPESERKPAYVPEKYDPEKDIVVRDFGKYNGQPLLLMENQYELYIRLGTDRHGIPLPGHDRLMMKVVHEISREDAILCLKCEREEKDDFYDLMEKRLEKEREIDYVRRILVDLGDSEIGRIYIARAECADTYHIRLVGEKTTAYYPLPKEYRENAEECKSLSTEQVLSFINEEIAKKEKRNQMMKEWQQKGLSHVVKDFGDTTDGHLSINHGKYGNHIRLVRDDESKNFRLPREYWYDDELCKSLTMETVVSFIDESKKRD